MTPLCFVEKHLLSISTGGHVILQTRVLRDVCCCLESKKILYGSAQNYYTHCLLVYK